jgi:predicted metalloprotease
MGKYMANIKAPKARFSLLGYGAVALYISLLAVVAAGVYGFDLSTLLAAFHKSEMTRDQLRTGRMVTSTEDRTQCRSVKFNNETADLSDETVADCDEVLPQRPPGGAFGGFRSGFVGR